MDKEAEDIEGLTDEQTAEEARGILGAGYRSLRVETDNGELLCEISKETGITFGEKIPVNIVLSPLVKTLN